MKASAVTAIFVIGFVSGLILAVVSVYNLATKPADTKDVILLAVGVGVALFMAYSIRKAGDRG